MNKKVEINSDIKKLSFEEALSELEGIVESLERGDIDLERTQYLFMNEE